MSDEKEDGPCVELDAPTALHSSCAAKLALSEEEEEVLARMRQVREESLPLKEELSSLEPGSVRRAELEARLAQNRERFKELKAELREANRIKMIRLGYLP